MKNDKFERYELRDIKNFLTYSLNKDNKNTPKLKRNILKEILKLKDICSIKIHINADNGNAYDFMHVYMGNLGKINWKFVCFRNKIIIHKEINYFKEIDLDKVK